MIDLFPTTPDPKRYVPRRASEWAIAALVEHIDRLSPVIALTGPSGIGKTLLIRVLAERVRHRLECVLVPYSALSPNEFAVFVLGLMDEPAGSDPEADLLEVAVARAAEGIPLALLVDDAASLPLDTGKTLVELARRSEGALRLILVLTDDERSAEFLAATSGHVQVVRFAAPMNLDETGVYLRACLERTNASPALQARLAGASTGRLHLESGGLPGALHECALELLAEPMAGASPGDLSSYADGVAPPTRTLRGWWRAFAESSAPLTRGQIFAAALVLGLSAVAVTLLRPEIEIPPVEVAQQTEPLSEPIPEPILAPSESVVTPEPSVLEPVAEPELAAETESEMEPEPVPAVALEPVPVNVNATPWAQVSVDGVDVGVTPLAGLPLLPGRHLFKARFPDGRVQERFVDITDEQRHVSFD